MSLENKFRRSLVAGQKIRIQQKTETCLPEARTTTQQLKVLSSLMTSVSSPAPTNTFLCLQHMCHGTNACTQRHKNRQM